MGFRCLDPETLEVRTLLHVSFDENSIEHRRDKLRDWDRRADAFQRKQLEDLPLIQDVKFAAFKTAVLVKVLH